MANNNGTLDFSFLRPEGNEGKGPEKGAALMSENEKNAIIQSEREKMLEYMRHPSYKERLKKEMFYDTFNPQNKKNVADLEEEYTRRLEHITSLPVSMAKFKDVNPETPFGAYYHEGSFRKDLPAEAKSKGIPQVVLSEDVEESRPMLINPLLYRQVLGHELGHASHRGELGGQTPRSGMSVPVPMVKQEIEKIQYSPEGQKKEAIYEMMSPEYMGRGKKYRQKVEEMATQKIGPEKVQMILEGQKRLNEEYKRLSGQYGKEYSPEKHGPYWDVPAWNEIQNPTIYENLTTSPSEVATRMIGLRRLASDKFGYDMNKEFDIKKYKGQIQDYFKKNNLIDEYKHLSKDLELSDDQINEMMKYIAKNKVPSQAQYTA